MAQTAAADDFELSTSDFQASAVFELLACG